jgi:hypothetical protein
MKISRTWIGKIGSALSLLALAQCDGGGSPDAKGCPCLSEKSALVADTLGGLLGDLVRTGAANGTPGGFTRGCDSIRYTYYAWFSVGDPVRADSQLTLNTLPLSVRIDRAGGDLIYEARIGGEALAQDTVRQWWIAFKAGDSAACLPNVENVIVDSIDGRLLALLDFPAWKLQTSLEDARASCDTLAARLILADPSHPRPLVFDVTAKAEGDSLAVTAMLGAQAFPLLRTSTWCRSLGIR